jgi:hypothetical protein
VVQQKRFPVKDVKIIDFSKKFYEKQKNCFKVLCDRASVRGSFGGV